MKPITTSEFTACGSRYQSCVSAPRRAQLPVTLISVHKISRSMSGESAWNTTEKSQSEGSAMPPNQP